MTMQQVLEGIKGLGERFDTHAKRLAALGTGDRDGRPRVRRRRRGQEES